MVTLTELEKRVKDLEKRGNEFGTTKKDKKPREKSKYNIFVQDFFKKNKGSSKTHKELFSEAAKAWSETKKPLFI